MNSAYQALSIDLADALHAEVIRTGAEAPAVRGATWQTAVVTAVAADGTLTAAGISGIRRLERFTDPVIGDTIIINQAASGAWIATDRLATSVGEWTALSFASGFSAAAGYQVPQYRLIGRTVHIRGSFTKSTTLVSGDVFTTVPTAIRPAVDHDMVIGGSHGTNGTNFGAFRGILRTNGTFEYRGPSVSTLVFIPPTTYWLS
ncbi:hypothetical protein [Streptomyces showdoensis]|uniref:Uncharacterized protein n=1 Tax=Streptomyces showdoensis TaxID=68268 RepID=A0A2P2GTK7_STREW|nr:hypothetical protein [Streptomyces showdoensis]KKZ74826.1 hypothetical protein VO63_05065 [Streptomyces showdoensis]